MRDKSPDTTPRRRTEAAAKLTYVLHAFDIMSPEELRTLRACIATHRQFRSDVRIICQGTIFRVHSSIISAHSNVLRQLCRSDPDRLGELEIRLDEEPLIAVKLMVDYLYSFEDYARQCFRDPFWPARYREFDRAKGQLAPYDPSMVQAQVFVIATKFELTHLADLALARFKDWTNVRTLSMTMLTNFPDSRTGESLTASFNRVVRYVYRYSSPQTGRLRYWLVHCMLADKPRMLREFTWVRDSIERSRDRFEMLLAEAAEFEAELKAAISSTAGIERKNVTRRDLWMAFMCGSVDAGKMFVNDDPPSDIHLEQEPDVWTGEAVDEEVLAIEEHPDYDVRVEVMDSEDPPSDVYPTNEAAGRDTEAAEREMEDVAAEVMDMLHT